MELVDEDRAFMSAFTAFDGYKDYLEKVAESNPKVKKAYVELLSSDKYIDTIMADMSLSEKEFIEIIALCRKISYSRAIGGANKAAENETDRLYAKNPWKFVEEFLQNADDCNYDTIPEINIIIDERDENHCFIEFCYNEEGFSRSDIWAITAFSESTKVDDLVKSQEEDGVFYKEKTGRKGKGFKSVFSLSAKNVIVHIRSNGFSFKLDNIIGRIMPVWEEDPERMDGKTHVIVELDKPEFSIGAIYPEFKRLFCVDNYEGIFAHSPFLFMHRLRLVNVTRICEEGEEAFSTEYRENKSRTEYRGPFLLNERKKVLAGIANGGTYYREQFQEGDITTLSGNDDFFSIPVIRYTRMVEDDEAYRNYSIISPLIKAETKTNWKGGALFRTFPMSLHPIEVPIAIDAPFVLNPDRSGVQYSPYKDEEGQQIPANIWNTEVRNRLFEKEGVYESFFMWLRSMDEIRIDRYMNEKPIILFADENNSDGHGNAWIPEVNISALCHDYPVFRLFANNEGYVSFNNARIVNKDLFSWPCVKSFFTFMLGEEYEKCIISDMYVGSSLFRAKPIVEEGFSDGINSYLDVVEDRLGLESASMIAFISTQLYPYLRDNTALINKTDPTAFKKMRIYLSRIKTENGIKVIREAQSDEIKWYHSDHGEALLSINRYRIYESSPVNIGILLGTVEGILGKKLLYINFGEKNQHNAAKRCRVWAEVRDFIEALFHFGFYSHPIEFDSLRKYVFSERLDPGFNAFRETGVLETIDDEDVERLSAYFDGSIEKTVIMLRRMGVRSGKDYFLSDGTYLVFSRETIEVLKSEKCPIGILQDISDVRADLKQYINATYDEIKECREDVLLYFLDEDKDLFATEPYTRICDRIQNDSNYWNRNDEVAVEILIRAIAGASETLKDRNNKVLSIKLEDVIRRKLPACIDKINHKKGIQKLIITNEGYFEEISDEEIKPRLKLLKYEAGETPVKYYKGAIWCVDYKRSYLRDIRGGNIYLKCDESGEYNTALEECLKTRFDTEALKYFDEMERQYQNVREEIIVPLFNKTEHDLTRTYDEIERRFQNYEKKQIISILSWFRSQGYTNALGNGNINNEKEIEDDYREDPWKFVYEFIQNVDDCSFSGRTPELRIVINRERDQIVFEYNEDGFTLEDVKALTKFGDSNKTGSMDNYIVQSGVFDLEKTGRKGRGFKSVFALPGDGIIVHVCSNGFSFKFIKRLGSIIPIWEETENKPTIGTRITVEGFTSGYTDTLMPTIKKMFGIDDLSMLFTVCPILFLRKLGKVSVISDEESFAVEIDTKEKDFDKNEFKVSGEPIAGIIDNGLLKQSLWEELCITVKTTESEKSFKAVKYSRMYSQGDEIRVASVFAPVMDSDSSFSFSSGTLYSTLPMSGHIIPIPISINASFDTNSGRSYLEDGGKKNAPLVRHVFGRLLYLFFERLSKLEGIRIERYVPTKRLILFEDYSRIDEIDLSKQIKEFPILRKYDGNGYVSCLEAKVLPEVCYEWTRPDILSECFDKEKEVLVDRCYSKFSLANRRINLNVSSFSESLNAYLDALDINEQAYIELLRNHIYPYIEKNYETILRKCREDGRQRELKTLRIFMFKMSDGSYVRECADEKSVWLKNVPESRLSFGRFRDLNSGSLTVNYLEQNWVKELHDTVGFDEAFTEKKLEGNEVEHWSQAEELIETILYYDIKQRINIPYLSYCVLSEEFDSEENYFRDGYIASGNRSIIDHLIDSADLQRIRDAAMMQDVILLQDLSKRIKEMGVKEANDFFDPNGRGVYSLSDSTVALLESFCRDAENAGIVFSAIEKSFMTLKSTKNVPLHISFEDVKCCSAPVFSRIFECEILSEETKKNLAEEFCGKYMPQETDDYSEAYVRGLNLIDPVSEKHSIAISLSQIKSRCLGACLQNCMISHMEDLDLSIIIDEDYSDYPSDEIDKALRWLDDEKAVSVSYEYYTTDLREAFGETSDPSGCFLFDDTKVLLQESDAENCMLKFVQKRYKGKDASFSALISIITEQNELKKPWERSKKEYVEKLKKFRKETLDKQKVLFPDYDRHLNNATGNAMDYVIPELLQNINDCKKGEGQETRTLEVSIVIQEGTMLLQYDEAGFDYPNVYSITAIGQSSKHDESEGEKGLGFKKVFSLFENVEIYSNGFCFSLSAEKSTVPEWIGNREKQDRYLVDGKTTMVFFAIGSKRNKLIDILAQWNDLVNGKYVGTKLSPLFLHNIDFIHLKGVDKYYSRTEMRKDYVFAHARLLSFYRSLLLKSNVEDVHDSMEAIRKQLKMRKKCSLMTADEQNDYINSLSVEICIPRKISEDNFGKGCLYSTLPTEKELFSTVFINVPLELSTGRDGIIEDSDYNDAIFKVLFSATDNQQSVFNRLLEFLADKHRELFLLNFIMPDVEKLMERIMHLSGINEEEVRNSFERLMVLPTYNDEELVSMETSYSVDRIIYAYLREVQHPVNNIEAWMKENSERAEDWKLLHLSTFDECDKVESFARIVNSPDGYFPLLEDDRDLMIEYLSNEYGYERDDDEDE